MSNTYVISLEDLPSFTAKLNGVKTAAGGAEKAMDKTVDALRTLAAEAKRATSEFSRLPGLLDKSVAQLTAYVSWLRAVADTSAEATRQTRDLGAAAMKASNTAAALAPPKNGQAETGESARQQGDDAKDLVKASGVALAELVAGPDYIKESFKTLGTAASELVGGSSPIKVLIEQGTNLIGIWRKSGLSFKDFAGEVGGAFLRFPALIEPVVAGLGWAVATALEFVGALLGGAAAGPVLAGVATAAALAFGGAALAARALNKENGDLTVGMGLTEAQLKRLKDQGVDTGVTIGDVFQGTFNYIRDAVEPVLAPVRQFFSDLFADISAGISNLVADIGAGISKLLDGITTGAVTAIKWLVGGFVGAFAAIKATWKMLPDAIGDLMVSAANFALRALNDFVNNAIDRINPFIDRINEAAKLAGLPGLTRLSQVDFGEIQNRYAGKAAATAAVAQQAFADAFRQTAAGIDKVFKDVGASIIKAGETRIRKGAGPAEAETAKKTGAASSPTAGAERAARASADVKTYADAAKNYADAAKSYSEAAKNCSCSTPGPAGAPNPAPSAPGLIPMPEPLVVGTTTIERAQLPSMDGFKPTPVLTLADAAKPIRETLREAVDGMRKTFQQASDAVASFKNALKQHDWAGAFSALKQTFDTVREAFGRGPVSGLTSLAGAVGSLVGGKTGKALSGGIGIASMGASLGGFLSGGGFAAAAANGAMALGSSVGFAAGLGNGIMALGSVMGPIALAAGALYAVAKIAGIGGKPSNHAAVAQISGDSFRMISTGKETQETTQAASAAADAIVKAQAAFGAAGISLARTVEKIDLGTRDRTHIFLSDGEELRSATGDASAAVDTALRALLQSATYVSDAQKKLVESALAAGEGFDKITEKLQAYAAAQGLSGQLNQEILKLTDPKEFTLQELKAAQKARRDSAKATADAGYLTADQLAGINAQLDKLDGLELANTLKQFQDAVEDSTKALAKQRGGLEADLLEAQGKSDEATAVRRGLQLEDMDPALRGLQKQVWAVQDAAAAVETARSNLSQAYEREAGALESTRDRFRDLAKALRESREALGQNGLSVQATAAVLRGRLLSTAAAARANDETAMGALPGLGREYLDAAKSSARSAAEYAREVTFVRATLEDAERYAETQATAAEQQLDLLKAQVSGILQVDASVGSVASALASYQQAVVALASANAAVEQPASEPSLRTVSGELTDAGVQRYLNMNGDLTQNWNAGGIMRQLGPDLLSAARAHYERTGQFEIAQGLRHALGFATGGSFEVGGGPGQDQNLVPLWLSRGEVVNIRRPGSANDNSAVVGAIQKLEGRLADMADALVAANSRLAVLEKLNRKWDGEGLPETRTA